MPRFSPLARRNLTIRRMENERIFWKQKIFRFLLFYAARVYQILVLIKMYILFYRDTLTPYVKRCIETFTSDWVLVHRKFKARISPMARDRLLQGTARQDFEVIMDFVFEF